MVEYGLLSDKIEMIPIVKSVDEPGSDVSLDSLASG